MVFRINPGHSRSGSVTVFLVLFFFSFFSASAGMLVSAYFPGEAALSKTGLEFTELTATRNRAEITRIKELSALSKEPWHEDGTEFSLRDSKSERLIRETVRQFPEPRAKSRYEEILYIALLNGGLSGRKGFSTEPDMTEQFKANIETAAKRLLPEWKENGEQLLFPLENFEQPYTSRWIFVPLLRNLSRSLQNFYALENSAKKIEKIFQFFLLSRFYMGTGAGNAQKAWEKLRRLEMSNVGRDSLGMYPGTRSFEM
jgi:hypothetical protein